MLPLPQPQLPRDYNSRTTNDWLHIYVARFEQLFSEGIFFSACYSDNTWGRRLTLCWDNFLKSRFTSRWSHRGDIKGLKKL